MNTFNPRKLAIAGILMALVVLSILLIHIPIPFGFIHVADSFILLSALLGPIYGAVVGGIGGMIGDLWLGFPAYAPWTLVIHSLQAIFMALALAKMGNMNYRMFFILGFVVSVITVVPGYYLADVLMYGSWGSPLIGIPLNLIQVTVGSGLGALLYLPFSKVLQLKK